MRAAAEQLPTVRVMAVGPAGRIGVPARRGADPLSGLHDALATSARSLALSSGVVTDDQRATGVSAPQRRGA